MSPYYLEATVLSLIFVIIQYRNFHQHHHCHHQSIYRHNHHHYVLFIIIVCNRNIRRATVLSLIFIPEEGIRSPCLSALKMFTHEHHTVPYFFLQCSQGQKHFCSWFYLLQRTYTTSMCSCNFHRSTTLSCSCYRYTVDITPILGVLKMRTRLILYEYAVSIANLLGEV